MIKITSSDSITSAKIETATGSQKTEEKLLRVKKTTVVLRKMVMKLARNVANPVVKGIKLMVHLHFT